MPIILLTRYKNKFPTTNSELSLFNINQIVSNEKNKNKKINDRLVTFVLIGQKNSWKFGFVVSELVVGSGKEDKWMISRNRYQPNETSDLQ